MHSTYKAAVIFSSYHYLISLWGSWMPHKQAYGLKDSNLYPNILELLIFYVIDYRKGCGHTKKEFALYHSSSVFWWICK